MTSAAPSSWGVGCGGGATQSPTPPNQQREVRAHSISQAGLKGLYVSTGQSQLLILHTPNKRGQHIIYSPLTAGLLLSNYHL